MKKIVLFLSIITLCTWVQAQGDENINPLNVARGFSLKTPASFEFSMNARILVDGSWKWTLIDFVVRKSDFAITNLSVDGVSIPLPKPIYGLPMGNGGRMENVNINVSARTSKGVYAGYGYVYVPVLIKGDRVEVTLRPGDIKIVLPLPPGTDPNDVTLEIDQFPYGFGYGTDEEGNFAVYLPPVGGSYQYVLHKRSDGTPLGTGTLEPFKQPVVPNDSYMAVKYIGNVIGVDFPESRADSWVVVGNAPFDCDVPTTEGKAMPGKVLFADCDIANLELSVWGNVLIHVYQVPKSGDMVEIPLENHSVTDPWGTETRVNTVSKDGIGKVVIVILPNPEGKVGDKIWINLHRYYGLPGSSGGGGGIGVTTTGPVPVKEF